MDAYNLHLLLNYYPLIGAFAGGLFLILGLWRKSDKLKRIGLWIIVAVAVLVFPVYVSGEITGKAYPIAGRMDVLKSHRLSALGSFGSVVVAGLAAAAALFLIGRKPDKARWFVLIALVVAVVGGVFLARTALIGRQIKWTTGHVRDSKNSFRTVNKNQSEMGEKLWLV